MTIDLTQLMTPIDLKRWIFNLPCVNDGRVIVDVRGPHMTLITKKLVATTVECPDDVVQFVLMNLD